MDLLKDFAFLFSFVLSKVNVFVYDETNKGVRFFDPQFLVYLENKGLEFSKSSQIDYCQLESNIILMRESRKGFVRQECILVGEGSGPQAMVKVYRRDGVACRDFYRLTLREKILFGNMEKSLRKSGLSRKERDDYKWAYILKSRSDFKIVGPKIAELASSKVYSSHVLFLLEDIHKETGVSIEELFPDDKKILMSPISNKIDSNVSENSDSLNNESVGNDFFSNMSFSEKKERVVKKRKVIDNDVVIKERIKKERSNREKRLLEKRELSGVVTVGEDEKEEASED